MFLYVFINKAGNRSCDRTVFFFINLTLSKESSECRWTHYSMTELSNVDRMNSGFISSCTANCIEQASKALAKFEQINTLLK